MAAETRSRLAVLDIDGTLTDTNDVDDECFTRAVGEVLGIEGPYLDWSAAPHVTDSGIAAWLCERAGRPLADADTAQIRTRFVADLRAELERAPHRFAPIPGAQGLVDRLHEAGWATAIATGGFGASARLKLRAAGIAVDERVFGCADDATTREEILRVALDRAVARRGAPFARVVSVGDGVWDVLAAAALGWPFVGVARGERAERLRAAGAVAVLPDFLDRDRLLHELETAVVPGTGRARPRSP